MFPLVVRRDEISTSFVEILRLVGVRDLFDRFGLIRARGTGIYRTPRKHQTFIADDREWSTGVGCQRGRRRTARCEGAETYARIEREGGEEIR